MYREKFKQTFIIYQGFCGSCETSGNASIRPVYYINSIYGNLYRFLNHFPSYSSWLFCSLETCTRQSTFILKVTWIGTRALWFLPTIMKSLWHKPKVKAERKEKIYLHNLNVNISFTILKSAKKKNLLSYAHFTFDMNNSHIKFQKQKALL